MDKSMPRKDHSRCTTDTCINYQIDPGSYELAHYGDGCRCAKLEINSSLITEILMKGDSIPLLKVIPGDDLGKLNIEIVESSSNTPYVALSHVWADGLGNPSSNSLHRCQLARLKDLLERLDTSTLTMDSRIPDTIKAKSASLLWLDTLCCPVIDGDAKQKAIERLRKVYKEANKVLVLDSSLFSISTEDLHTSEKIAKIYTSPWMRRLWTLQGTQSTH
jgi:hypothetical protein